MREDLLKKNPDLQRVIKKILNSISEEEWEFKGQVMSCGSQLGSLGFELKFLENNHWNVYVNGGIKVNENDLCWISIKYEQKYRFDTQTALYCFISIDDDVENVLGKVQYILKGKPEFYQLIAERKALQKLGSGVYIDKYLNIIGKNWEFSLGGEDEDKENEDIDLLVGTCKNVINRNLCLKAYFFLDGCGDYIIIRSKRWGNVQIDLDDEVRQKVLKNICNQLDVEVSYFLQEIDETLEDIEETLEDINYVLESQDFLIRTTKYLCAKYNHQLERIRAIINILTSTGVESIEVDAMYCVECKEYYISESDFNKVKRYGTLCHKIVTVDEYLKIKENYSSWSDKSLLSSYGYSANEQDDLSDAERQRILAFLIENDIASIESILSFLEWLVRNRGARCYKACEKWERDIKFVRNYKPIGRYVIVKDINVRKRILPI